VLGGIPSRGKF